ncbi:MAG: hypothetical protein ACKVTZ_00465, partial [Bacteroidia bacterium]
MSARNTYSLAIERYCKICFPEKERISRYDSLCHQLHCSVQEEEAVVVYNQGLTFLEEAQAAHLSKEYLLFGHYLMGILCSEQQLYSESLIHIKKAYSLAKQLKLTYIEAFVQHNWAAACFSMEQYDEALAHYFEAQRLGIEKEKKASILFCTGISACYLRKEEETPAIRYGLKAVHIADSLKDTTLLSSAYTNYAQVCMGSDKEFRNVLYYLNNAEKYAKALNDGPALMVNYYNKYLVYEHKNDEKQALECLYQYNFLRDSLYGQDKVWQLAKKKEVLEVQKRELEIAKQKAENEEHKTKMRLGGGMVLLLVLLLAGAYYSRFRILQQKKELELLNDFKNRLFGIIGHDLKSSVTQLTQAQTQWSKHYEQDAQHPLLAGLLLKAQRISSIQRNILDNVFSWGKLLLNSQYYEKTVFPLRLIL